MDTPLPPSFLPERAPRSASPVGAGDSRGPHGHRAAGSPSVPDSGNRRLLAVNEQP